jgi:hypothetical protein
MDICWFNICSCLLDVVLVICVLVIVGCMDLIFVMLGGLGHWRLFVFLVFKVFDVFIVVDGVLPISVFIEPLDFFVE